MAVPGPSPEAHDEGFATFAFVGSLALVAELWLPGDELRWLPVMESNVGKYLGGLTPTPIVSYMTRSL